MQVRGRIQSLFGHRVLRSSAIVFLASTVANFSGWLYHIVVGRILGPDHYAELSALLALFFILNVFSGVIQTVLVRFFSILKARQSYGEAKQLYWTSTRFIAFSEIVGLFVMLPLIPSISSFLHIGNFWYFVWVYLIFATTTIGIVNGAALQGFQRFIPFSLFANIGMVLRLMTGAIFAFLGVGWTLVANVIANVVSYFLYFLPLSFLLQHKVKPLTITKSHAARYGVPVLLATLGITVMNSQDILLVKHYFSSYEAGIYSSLSVLGKVIFYASSAVGFVLFPIVAEKSELRADSRRSVTLGLLVVGMVSAVITAGYFLFPSIAILPFGAAFAPAAPYVGLFGIFVTMYTMATMLLNILLAMGKASVWILPVVAAAFQTILIVFLHQSIYDIIWINFAAAALLGVVLFFSYRYATTRH
ncbi:hypothetical protein HY086_02090 [Candidatus Gottesmanbacteria bacterium]|nr:hypothetical protein [Candidatus Gottesmanbacteria bacterium]